MYFHQCNVLKILFLSQKIFVLGATQARRRANSQLPLHTHTHTVSAQCQQMAKVYKRTVLFSLKISDFHKVLADYG